MLYPNHRLPPWFTEDAARDRSNRWLDQCGGLYYGTDAQERKCLPSFFTISEAAATNRRLNVGALGRNPSGIGGELDPQIQVDAHPCMTTTQAGLIPSAAARHLIPIKMQTPYAATSLDPAGATR
jgi:hypothetical protein